jgi:hypothetical protein
VLPGVAEDVAEQLEAPFTTAGCPVKSGVEATKPTTLTMRTTLSSPTSASMAASALSAQVRASSLACSGVTRAPTLPTAAARPRPSAAGRR